MRRRPLCLAGARQQSTLLIETVCFGTSASTTCPKYTSTSKPSAGVNKRERRALGFPSLLLCLCDLTVARSRPWHEVVLTGSVPWVPPLWDGWTTAGHMENGAFKHAPAGTGRMSRGINLWLENFGFILSPPQPPHPAPGRPRLMCRRSKPSCVRLCALTWSVRVEWVCEAWQYSLVSTTEERQPSSSGRNYRGGKGGGEPALEWAHALSFGDINTCTHCIYCQLKWPMGCTRDSLIISHHVAHKVLVILDLRWNTCRLYFVRAATGGNIHLLPLFKLI